MQPQNKNIFSLALGLGISCTAFAAETNVKLVEPFIDETPYRIQLINNTAYQNNAKGFNNAILWFPLWQRRDFVSYAQLNQLNRFDGLHGMGANLGVRWLNASQNWLFGVHTGYRNQISETKNTYQQWLLGGEMRTADWHAYGNVYIPISKSKRETTHDLWLAQSANDTTGFYNVLTKQGIEQVLHGGDASVGYRFWDKLNARFYVGGYYYEAVGVKSISGPRAKLEFDLYNAFNQFKRSTILNRISFEAQVQHDNTYKTMWYAGIKFAFTLGKKQSLNGLQQYMQTEAPQDYFMTIRPNDAVSPDVFKNADGTPLSIAYVEDTSALTSAISNNAEVIAVRDSIADVDKITLNDNQVLTGGTYTLSNGVEITPGLNGELTASSGQDLIQVGKNNHIENITLNADNTQQVIVNDQSSTFGTLKVNNINANAGIGLKVTDGSEDANFILTDSTFTMGNVSNSIGVQLQVEHGVIASSINNNSFNFGNGASNKGLDLQVLRNAQGAGVYNINSINSNTISFNNGNANTGMYFNLEDNSSYIGTMTVSNIQNNTISFASANAGFGISANVSSITGNGVLTFNNMLNNTISVSAGTGNSAIYMSAGAQLFDGSIIINKIYGNQATLPTGNEGFNLQAGTGDTDSLSIVVNNNGLGLSAANNNMSVSKQGNVTITPAE